MRRDDRQLWNRVARTVDPIAEARRAARVPVADPKGEVVPRPTPRPDPIGREALRVPGSSHGPAQGSPRRAEERARSAGASKEAAPALSDAASETGDRSFLDALENWWSGVRAGGPGPVSSVEALRPAGELRSRGRGAGANASLPGAIDRPTRRRIARRRLPLEGRIDLHGMDQETAHGALLSFLHRSRAEGLRHVIVITGKGRRGHHDGGEGVLRRAVPRWLGTQPFRGLVSGTTPAARHDGGEGALYVKLKRVR